MSYSLSDPKENEKDKNNKLRYFSTRAWQIHGKNCIAIDHMNVKKYIIIYILLIQWFSFCDYES